MRNILCLFAIALLMANCGGSPTDSSAANIRLNDSLYFEKTGFNVLVFNNMYDNLFDDSKVSAVEIIHHGIRTATNGDVRLNPSPGQWDPIPKFVERKVDAENGRIEVTLNYPAYNFRYTLAVEASGDGVLMSVNTETPIPDELNGIAGLNIELFPPVFWGASYIIDGKTGLFPTVPSADITTINGQNEPLPVVSGKKIDIAPDVPAKHLTVSVTDDSELSLYDGRSKQQNGTFTLRTLLPAGKSGKIAEWFITGESLSGWKREPVVAYSQVGYHPAQQKIAVIELDKNDNPLSNIVLWKVNADGSRQKALAGKPELWGQYLRYNYLKFNFSEIKESGIYLLEYGKQIAGPFP
ncbi:MAG: glycoside hydrolase, partial [Dysgonamonadaceae bacterium]|nr:glycoside hydrolase [Dysgonamonadaceae bacterium]